MNVCMHVCKYVFVCTRARPRHLFVYARCICVYTYISEYTDIHKYTAIKIQVYTYRHIFVYA